MQIGEKLNNLYILLIISPSRFAKRKLDEFVFLGNRLQVSYAPQFESLDDTKDKLEGRRKEVLARLNRKLIYYSKKLVFQCIYLLRIIGRELSVFK